MFSGSGNHANLGQTTIGPSEQGAEVDREQAAKGKERPSPPEGWAFEAGVCRRAF